MLQLKFPCAQGSRSSGAARRNGAGLCRRAAGRCVRLERRSCVAPPPRVARYRPPHLVLSLAGYLCGCKPWQPPSAVPSKSIALRANIPRMMTWLGLVHSGGTLVIVMSSHTMYKKALDQEGAGAAGTGQPRSWQGHRQTTQAVLMTGRMQFRSPCMCMKHVLMALLASAGMSMPKATWTDPRARSSSTRGAKPFRYARGA